jgi:hypothetical protein
MHCIKSTVKGQGQMNTSKTAVLSPESNLDLLEGSEDRMSRDVGQAAIRWKLPRNKTLRRFQTRMIRVFGAQTHSSVGSEASSWANKMAENKVNWIRLSRSFF